MARFTATVTFRHPANTPDPEIPTITKKVKGIIADPPLFNLSPGLKVVKLLAEFEDGTKDALNTVPGFSLVASAWKGDSGNITVAVNPATDGMFLVFTVPPGLPDDAVLEYSVEADVG